MRPIRVLVVEDSLVFRELLVKSLNADPAIEVVAVAGDAFEARDAIVKHRPDVMTLDIELPHMSGLEFLKKLMPQYPLPTVVISSLSDKVFDALNAGAVDFVAKPVNVTRQQLESFMKHDLTVKVKVASIAKVSSKKKVIEPPMESRGAGGRKDIVIAIGASTGGTEAIASILKQLDIDTPGVVIVQHMPPGFTDMYAKRLNGQCRMVVKEAKNGDPVVPGQALIAPGGDAHMRLIKVNGSYKVEVKEGPRISGHCPSVDALFHSVAQVAGKDAMGVILTGMGGDGSDGLLAMRKAGARTIGQDESTCVVYGMPKVAFDKGAVERQEKLGDIPRRMFKTLNEMK